MCCCPFQHYRTLLLWRKQNHCNFQLYSLHWNVYKLFVARTVPAKNKLCQYVVSTRWGLSAYCKQVNYHCSKHDSQAPHFLFWGHAVAPSFSRSVSTWCFPLGILKIIFTQIIHWMIWRKPSGRKCIRSIVSCWFVSKRILRKLENCNQEDGRHLSDIIYKTWLPFMTCFELSFCTMWIYLKTNWVLFNNVRLLCITLYMVIIGDHTFH